MKKINKNIYRDEHGRHHIQLSEGIYSEDELRRLVKTIERIDRDWAVYNFLDELYKSLQAPKITKWLSRMLRGKKQPR